MPVTLSERFTRAYTALFQPHMDEPHTQHTVKQAVTELGGGMSALIIPAIAALAITLYVLHRLGQIDLGFGGRVGRSAGKFQQTAIAALNRWFGRRVTPTRPFATPAPPATPQLPVATPVFSTAVAPKQVAGSNTTPTPQTAISGASGQLKTVAPMRSGNNEVFGPSPTGSPYVMVENRRRLSSAGTGSGVPDAGIAESPNVSPLPAPNNEPKPLEATPPAAPSIAVAKKP